MDIQEVQFSLEKIFKQDEQTVDLLKKLKIECQYREKQVINYNQNIIGIHLQDQEKNIFSLIEPETNLEFKHQFVQLIANSITQNQQNKVPFQFKKIVYDKIINTQSIIHLLNKKDEKLAKFIAIFLHNFLINSDFDICVNNFDILIKYIYNFLHKDIDDALFEWIFLLSKVLIRNYHLEFLHKSIDQQKDLIELVFISVSKIIEERSHPGIFSDMQPTIPDVRDMYSQKGSSEQILLCKKDLRFLLDLLKDQINNVQDNQKQDLFFIHLLLKILVQSTFLGGYIIEIQEQFTENDLHILMKFLNMLKKQFCEKDNSTFLINENSEEILPTSIRLISNLAHINKNFQQFILDHDYLSLVISFSGEQFNKQSFLIKEWTVMLIRNLTDGNEVIRKKISDLKLIDFEAQSKEFIEKFEKASKINLFDELKQSQ